MVDCWINGLLSKQDWMMDWWIIGLVGEWTMPETARWMAQQEIGDGLGGDGFGVVAVGHDAAKGSSPA